LDNKTPLTQLLDLANVVIVNNSTVGIEALLKQKVLVVLGKAFYDFDEICLKINNKNELKDILFKAQNKTVNKMVINGFLYNLFNNHLIEGDIASKKPIAAQKIASIITKLLS
jgi:capsular polysaccharide export protein